MSAFLNSDEGISLDAKVRKELHDSAPSPPRDDEPQSHRATDYLDFKQQRAKERRYNIVFPSFLHFVGVGYVGCCSSFL
jgi:hypothetical protein